MQCRLTWERKKTWKDRIDSWLTRTKNSPYILHLLHYGPTQIYRTLWHCLSQQVCTPLLLLQVHLKLHVHPLVIPVLCIWISFAKKRYCLACWSSGDMGYENFYAKSENYFIFVIRINLKTDMCPMIHRIRSDDLLHIPDNSHDLYENRSISIFHTQCILVFMGIIKLEPFCFDRKSKSKSVKCIPSTFSHPACEKGCKHMTILQLLSINLAIITDKNDFYSSCNKQIFNV